MKISALMQDLLAIRKEHGDIEVGLHNDEFDTYGPVVSAFARKARRSGDWPDGTDLTDTFVAISYLPESHTSMHDTTDNT